MGTGFKIDPKNHIIEATKPQSNNINSYVTKTNFFNPIGKNFLKLGSPNKYDKLQKNF